MSGRRCKINTVTSFRGLEEPKPEGKNPRKRQKNQSTDYDTKVKGVQDAATEIKISTSLV